MINNKLFGDINVSNIASDPNFKEDSVREVILLPIIKVLGYTEEAIERSKTLKHPFLKQGSNKKIEVKLIPDYCLKIGQSYSCMLEAKAPNVAIDNKDMIGQAYSYAIHPEVRAKYFALCNGVQFVLYRSANPNEILLQFEITNIEENWQLLQGYLAITNLQEGKVVYQYIEKETNKQGDDWYKTRPLLNEIAIQRQAAKRHFGCNAYFTRQTWNVVSAYIKNFSQQGDVVLDPFGGSGVTAIEAMMLGRQAIHNDLNPLSVFMTESMLAPVTEEALFNATATIKDEYTKLAPKSNDEVDRAIKKYGLPKNINLALPKGSDVATVRELFSARQLAELALLKHLIKKIKDKNVQISLLLAFYNTITVCNLTFHETHQRPGLGGYSFMVYYRYRVAYEPFYISAIDVFEKKVKRIVNGKQEMRYYINQYLQQYKALPQVVKGSATNLTTIETNSIDYIYTDPPYGKNIAYLDLSTIYNVWLDLEVTEDDYKTEAIEGGEHNQPKATYNALIADSIKEMYRVLKWDRYLTFVFAHKDPEFWDLIMNTAELCGFEYVKAVPQKNAHKSFKKWQNPFSVLTGQVMINFRKARNPKALLMANLGMDTGQIIMQTIEGIIARDGGATLEQINDELVIKGIEMGFLGELKKEYSDLGPLLDSYDFNEQTELFTLKKNTKFKFGYTIPLELRIKYYVVDYLRRCEREAKRANFDDIVLNIMPLLKNGVTPDGQTILSVLQEIAEHSPNNEGCWRLKEVGQKTLF
jgi:DNA modification methylase